MVGHHNCHGGVRYSTLRDSTTHRFSAIYETVRFLILLATASTLLAGPSITGVVNGASNIPPGLPNSGVAQGSIIVIYGSGLGPASLVQAKTFPLPSTGGLSGTLVTASVQGITTNCIMFYTSVSQVAVVLPSATPVGTGTLTVTYDGQSASIPLQVLAANWGTIALNGSGTGPAVVTDANYVPITLVHPAAPGQTLILWGTGLGPVAGDETEPPAEVDLGTGVQVFVEGQSAAVIYGGRSGSPGLDQINFTIPSGISGGCRTSIAVLLKGITANVTTMAVAPPGQSTCSDSVGILTSANLQKALSSGTLNTAGITLYRFGTNSDFVTADFYSYPVNTLTYSYGGSLGASVGSCTAYESLGSSVVVDPIQPPRLDAGANLTLTGPAGSKTIAATSIGDYSAALGNAATYIEAGSFTVSNGNGGAGVGAFSQNLTLSAPISITNFPPAINRSQDLTVAWSSSSSFSAVSVFVVSGVPSASGTTSYVQFYCTAAASAGQLTIPSVILQLLPTNGYGSPGVAGAALEIAGIAGTGFTATGSPGLDAAVFDAFTYGGKVLKVQ